MKHALRALATSLLVSCVSSDHRAPALAPGSVIDMHAHAFFDDAPRIAELVAQLDDPRVARLAAIVMAAPGDPDAVVRQNDALFALVAEHPRLFAVASVHPADGARALAELERVAGLGAKMIKLHQNTQKFDLADPAVGEMLEKAGQLGLPVLFEGTAVLDPATFGKLLVLAASHPRSRLVVAHMGFMDFPQMVLFETMEAYEWWPRNVWFDLSATAATLARSPFEDELVWTIRRLGVERVMFGSDFPVFRTGEALDALLTMGFTPAELDALTRTTAAELLDLR